VHAHYLAGCDGGKSLVRHSLKLGFTGGSSSGTFFVADTTATGKLRPDDLNLILKRDRFFAIFPMLGRDRHRVVGSFSGDATLPPAEAFEAVRPELEARGVLHVEALHWFSTYRVHHRVAEHFRVGRVFLLGDAGHIHSPVGGQGMNTGLGDAVNLAWKLAQAVQGGDKVQADTLLDTYESERMPFARALIQSTDRAFQVLSNTALWASFIRTQIAPVLLPLLTRPRPVRRELLLRVAQTRIHYPQSPLSSGRAGQVRGGDRLPWVKTEGGSNFDALKSLDWQLHVYGSAPADLERWCEIHALPLTTFPFNKQAQNAGFAQNALYLVRPDGYIGLVLPEFERERLEAYAERWLREPSPAARASRPPTPTD
jgi:hypothetical protein